MTFAEALWGYLVLACLATVCFSALKRRERQKRLRHLRWIRARRRTAREARAVRPRLRLVGGAS